MAHAILAPQPRHGWSTRPAFLAGLVVIVLAVGARPSNILSQFLIEAIILSIVGGMIGILVGILGSALLSRLAGPMGCHPAKPKRAGDNPPCYWLTDR